MGCCAHASAASRFFSFFARRYRKRYQKKGFEKSQDQLVEGIWRCQVAHASLLEIGCGIGYLHQFLLEQGAGSAIGIDLSDKMLQEAEALAYERGLASRTDYRQGDFVDMSTELPAADVVILDKVVCCYPDAESMVQRSLAKTRRVYALSYPRNRWYVRFGMAMGALMMWLMRSDFRSFVHDPKHIEDWITEQGFTKEYQAHTLVWLTQVYTRAV